MQNIFTARNFAGALLFMILVGEFQLGGVDKTLTPFGIVLYAMYFTIFNHFLSNSALSVTTPSTPFLSSLPMTQQQRGFSASINT